MLTASQKKSLLKLDNIQSVLEFLASELNWPVQNLPPEYLTYDFEPRELGLKEEHFPKINKIYQVRPPTSKVPWGIFFIDFENKKLPKTIMRRILNHLRIKNRSRAIDWNASDLLFMTTYGEDSEGREIAFAHFHQTPGDLPALNVLQWDSHDTDAKLEQTLKTLKTSLAWPQNPTDTEAWRRQWSAAFKHELGHTIKSARELANKLAELSKDLCERCIEILEAENEQGPINNIYKGFRDALIHDLKPEEFADTFAQTISYGLLTTAFSRTDEAGGAAGTSFTTEDFGNLVPTTNPFLKEVLDIFLDTNNRYKHGINFDELGIQSVVELLRSKETDLPAIRNDFMNRKPGEDPVIFFYEEFLAAYNKAEKIKRGVFYTPQPIVSYIVRSVHELLQTEFGLQDGLADTTTWGEMLQRNPTLQLPLSVPDQPEFGTISPSEPFVQILDPATGTGTFLVEVITVIHQTMTAKWQSQGKSKQELQSAWNEYVPNHLLPRLHAFELMMAPYAIAHMKIGIKLFETGYGFGTNERARIYLTNALEPWVKQLPLIGLDALAHEAAAVNEIKRHKRFTVVIGNPPYSGISANMSEAIIDLVEPYKSINGVSLGERKIWAQDDYKKFIRFCQLKISSAGCGILGLITNHGFINEPTSRGMRHNLLATFPRVSVLDLHGSLKKREVCPDGSPDKNVFDIEPGVAISFLRRGGPTPNGVCHSDLWGLRESKYDYLLRHTLQSTPLRSASPSPEFYLFVPQSEDGKNEFAQLVSVTEIFESGSNGIQTSRDHVVYGFSKAECRAIIEEFRSAESSMSTHELREKYWPGKKVANYAAGDTRGWQVPEARRDLGRDDNWEDKFRKALYRPFDFQTLFYAAYMIDWPRTEVMSQMLRPNLSLCVGRAGSAADNQEWNVVFVSNALVDMNLFYRGGNVSYPLRFAAVSGSFAFDRKPRPNFKPLFLKKLSSALGSPQTNDFDLPAGLTPEDIFHYAYAVFHSPGYRSRYAEFLKIDFPRLPLTGNLELFRALARLGGELTALHLLESPTLESPITQFIGSPNPEVGRVAWSNNTVWLNAPPCKSGATQQPGTCGFQGVPEDVWNIHIGGYQVCQKWLKDRKGRTLTDEDIAHYHKIIVALTETIRLMTEIDEVINQHGGWPGAFQTETANNEPSNNQPIQPDMFQG